MFRALSTRRGCHAYDRLGKERDQLLNDEEDYQDAKLMRTRSVPATSLFGSSKKSIPESDIPPSPLTLNPHLKKSKKKGSDSHKNNKNQSIGTAAHPLFGLFDGSYWKKSKKKLKRKDMTTANPQFARYLQYVKEGGVWDNESNAPVIYYK